MQRLYFEKLVQLIIMLHGELQYEWTWKLHDEYNNRIISRIYTTLTGASILNKEYWPDVISFLKPRIIALDRFWEDAKHGFEELM